MSVEEDTLRWRLILGEAAQQALGGHDLDPQSQATDRALSWLYGREDKGQSAERSGVMTVPEWINSVHSLFPRSTIERLERDAIERYQITEAVTSKAALALVRPSPALLKAILQTKHLMKPEVLAMARQLVRQVVQQLMAKLQVQIRAAFRGTPDRNRRSNLAYSRNFDAKRTLRENLRHVDRQTGKLVVKRPVFVSRTRQHHDRWQILLVVDQSGSMLDSTIHAAVTAACFWRLPGVRTHLIAFDTQVVDLTRDVDDPVELLMKVQLGGGTNIGQAVDYAAQQIDNPRRALVVLITDFYEGADPARLIQSVRGLCQQGTKVLGLAALDANANPDYDRGVASRLVQEGAWVGAMTPDKLAEVVAEMIGR